MNKSGPKFWGSYKGRILKSIAVDGARSWTDLQELTGFHPKTLNRILYELISIDAIEKIKNGEYRAARDLYYEYKEFFEEKNKNETLKPSIKVKHTDQQNIMREFQNWLSLKKIDLTDKHVFLEGAKIENLTNHLIENIRSEIIIVNPYIGKGNIVTEIKSIARKNVNIRILTRRPEEEKNLEILDLLSEIGVSIKTNQSIHAKIFVLDRGVAIVTSMNLYAFSSGGGVWEAGLATASEKVIEEILNSIETKFDDLETTVYKK